MSKAQFYTKNASNDQLFEAANVVLKSWQQAYKGIIPQEYLDNLDVNRWAKLNDGVALKLLFEGEKIIGVAYFGRTRDEDKQNFGEIYSLYLLPQFWGQGLGNILIQAVLCDLQKQGFGGCSIWTLDVNVRAQRAYKKAGFVLDEGAIKKHNIMGTILTDTRYNFYF